MRKNVLGPDPSSASRTGGVDFLEQLPSREYPVLKLPYPDPLACRFHYLIGRVVVPETVPGLNHLASQDAGKGTLEGLHRLLGEGHGVEVFGGPLDPLSLGDTQELPYGWFSGLESCARTHITTSGSRTGVRGPDDLVLGAVCHVSPPALS